MDRNVSVTQIILVMYNSLQISLSGNVNLITQKMQVLGQLRNTIWLFENKLITQGPEHRNVNSARHMALPFISCSGHCHQYNEGN